MTTRTFTATEPDALVTSVTVSQVGGAGYVEFYTRGDGSNVGYAFCEPADTLALASRLLGRDVTEDT